MSTADALASQDPIPEHTRNATFSRLAGLLRQQGKSLDEATDALLAINIRRCDPPLGEKEVRRVAHSIFSRR